MDKNFVKKFLKGSVAITIGQFSAIVFHFLTITFMARYATKEALGLYFLILAVANGGKILASLGLDLTFVKYLVSEEPDVQQQTFAVIIWTRLLVFSLMAVLFYILGSALLGYFSMDIVPYRLTLPLLFALMSFRELFFYIMQGLQQYRMYATVQTISAAFKLLLVVLLRDTLTLDVMLATEFAMLIVSLVIQLWLVPLKTLGTRNMLFQRSILTKVFRFGFPLYISSMITYISNFGAVFIVGYFLTPVSIAAYEVARKIPEGFMRLFVSFHNVYYPSLSSLFAKDDLRDGQKLMNKSLILLAALSFTVVLGGLLFSREIILFVFSERWLDAQVQNAFVLMLLAVCMQLLANTMGFSLVSAGHPRYSTTGNVISMGMQLLLSLLLIPFIGYVGAAIAYVAMTLIAQALHSYYLRSIQVNVDWLSLVKPYAFLLIVAAMYLLVGSDNWFWRIGLFVLYLGLCVAFIADCRQAALFLWDMRGDFTLRQKHAS
jgi:O-antigen/teichoic acid export membrane protein